MDQQAERESGLHCCVRYRLLSHNLRRYMLALASRQPKVGPKESVDRRQSGV